MSAPAIDLSTVPGAMQRTLTREIPDGVVDFEEAPVGWLGKNGQPRKRPWRAYFWTETGADRVRLPSTTTLLDEICPKPGLVPWSEARGIEGLLTAIHGGQVDVGQLDADAAIQSVRRLGLGAEGAKKAAASRGLNIHAVLETYMLTGAAPKLSEHPEHHRGYIQALAKWLLARNPEPIEVEQLVVNPEAGYAGRLDLRAMIGGRLETVDAKTQERAAIYPGAHWQVSLYERAAIRSGAEPADGKRVVVFAADGEWREMAADHEEWRVDAALAFWRAQKPIGSACESANRSEKEARR